jgi:hypothetical protein
MEEGSAEILLVACCLRQALIFTLRKSAKDSFLHTHEQFAFFPLIWTCIACALAMIHAAPALGPGITEAHLGLVLAPQLLTWFWCLQNRGEIPKSEFTAHALGLAATFVLLLTGGQFGAYCAVITCTVAVLKRSNFPRSRQSFFWVIMLVISFQRSIGTSYAINSWTLALCEVSMMYVIKIRIPIWFSFDKRLASKVQTESQEFSDPSVSDSQQLPSPFGSADIRRSGPLLSLESLNSEEAGSVSSGPELIRGDSLNARTPPDLLRTDSLTDRKPPGAGHRRGVSTQSSGSGWAWGLAVQDFVAKSLSPPSSSDEEDDDLNDDLV